MLGAYLFGVHALRWVQLALVILALIFSICSTGRSLVCIIMIVLFSLVTIYQIMVLAINLSGRSPFSAATLAVVEIITALSMIALTIYATATVADKDTWLVLVIVLGFILPALYFITAFERM